MALYQRKQSPGYFCAERGQLGRSDGQETTRSFVYNVFAVDLRILVFLNSRHGSCSA